MIFLHHHSSIHYYHLLIVNVNLSILANAQQFVNKLLILDLPIFRLTLLQKLLNLILSHRNAIDPQKIPQFRHRHVADPIRIKDPKCLHKFFLHINLIFLLNLQIVEDVTKRVRKSVKSILEEYNGLSYLLTRSPNISIIYCYVIVTPNIFIIAGISFVCTKPESSSFSKFLKIS